VHQFRIFYCGLRAAGNSLRPGHTKMYWIDATASGANSNVMYMFLWPPTYGQAIIFCSCGFYLSSSSFFLTYSQRSQTGCLPVHFHSWCGRSANLECKSEICCTRVAEIQDAKITLKIAICAPLHAQLCRAISSQRRHMSTIGKKTY